ncbi:MAG TPA: hypothetical protein VFV43_10305 [Limnobacter sp.]|nr:hypothetical protein [Limnobacter sp.]
MKSIVICSRSLWAQSGYIASYVMYGIALLAMVGVGVAKINYDQRLANQTQSEVDNLALQIESIRAKILLCAAIYENGDHGLFPTRRAFPAPATADGRANLSTVVCPGAPGGLTLSQLSDGVRLPSPPPGFDPWIYQHTEAGGIRLRLGGGSDAVRERLHRRYPDTSAHDGSVLEFLILG